jgi:hypothetical protein
LAANFFPSQSWFALGSRDLRIPITRADLISADQMGRGKGAYFMRPSHAPRVCRRNAPLTFRNVGVHRVQSGGYFDLVDWKSDVGTSYSLSVEAGRIQSTQAEHSVY